MTGRIGRAASAEPFSTEERVEDPVVPALVFVPSSVEMVAGETWADRLSAVRRWRRDDTIEHIRDHGQFDSLLLPLDIYEDGTKAIMIRTGDYDGVVIESRRPVFPDHDLVRWEEVGRDPYGQIVYEVDGRAGGAAGTLKVVPPIGQTVKELPSPLVTEFLEKVDALLNIGAVAEIQGLRIELLHSGDRDLVRIGPAT